MQIISAISRDELKLKGYGFINFKLSGAGERKRTHLFLCLTFPYVVEEKLKELM